MSLDDTTDRRNDLGNFMFDDPYPFIRHKIFFKVRDSRVIRRYGIPNQFNLVSRQGEHNASAFDKFDHPTVQEFKNLDITKRKLIYEGPLQWRRTEQNRAKPVDLHVVLLDDTIFFLHRQDEKYLLKFINTSQANSVLSPIVKVSTVLVRHNAVDKNSLYLVNTSQNGAQIYDLVAASPAERKLWCKHISETAEAYKTRDRQGRRPTPPTTLPEESVSGMDDTSLALPSHVEGKTDHTAEQEHEPEHEHEREPEVESELEREHEQKLESEQEHEKEQKDRSDNLGNIEKEEDGGVPDAAKAEPSTSDSSQQHQPQQSESPTARGIGEPLRMVITEISLIDPLEVHVEVPSVHVAEPVLTTIECPRRVGNLRSQAGPEHKKEFYGDKGIIRSGKIDKKMLDNFNNNGQKRGQPGKTKKKERNPGSIFNSGNPKSIFLQRCKTLTCL
ncbi:hypothetical protein HZH68_010898 [Vespula germanica]|uniref:PH domain-containing protein n=1 Tax=Vespula germanica TaxID=30212 RepID=A0A834JW99_VESGE|nr:hypothetical protein HZH68_010898 [Vespula germanica]